MRKLLGMAMVAGLIATGGLANNASAGITVDLLFVKHNGGAITPTASVNAVSGDTLDLAVIFRNDVQLTGIQFTTSYDLQLNQAVPTADQWHGVALNKTITSSFQPLGPISITPPLIGAWNSTISNLASTLRLNPGSYQIGTVHFQVGINVLEAHIHAGAFTPGDGAGDAFFNQIGNTILYGEAVVNPVPVPEPGTAALLGIGLVGLVLAGRRNRA